MAGLVDYRYLGLDKLLNNANISSLTTIKHNTKTSFIPLSLYYACFT
jgi:hypothetical protein